MRRFVILALIVLAMVLVWTGGWLYAAGRVRAEIEALAEADFATLSCGRLDIAGYPFRFDVTCANATITRLDLSLNSPEIKATALVYRLGHVIGFVQPPIAITDAFFGTERELRFTSAEASLRLSGWEPASLGLERLSVRLEGAELHDTLIGDDILLTFSAAEFHLTNSAAAGFAPGGIAGFATAEGLDYPEAGIAAATLAASAQATELSERPMDWTDPDLLRNWSADGGMLELKRFEFTAEGLELSATGQARIEANGLVSGTLSATSLGLVERIDPQLLGEATPLLFGSPDPEGRYASVYTVRAGVLFAPGLPLPLMALQTTPLF